MIAVFGSIGVDMVIALSHLPGPGETVLAPDYQMLPGGKGANQALAAARAGGEVRMIACVGDDADAEIALFNLAADGVDISQVQSVKNARTAKAVVLVDDNGENQIVVASGANLHCDIAHLPPDALQPGDIVQLQLEIPAPAVWSAIALGKAAGCTTMLNAAPFQSVPEAVLRQLDVLNLNQNEAAMMAAALHLPADDLASLARRLSLDYELCAIITLGSEGTLCAHQEQGWRVSTLAIDAIDTVGAGDGFVGAFAAAWDTGHDVADCLRRGSVAGALACTAPGAQASLPDVAEITARLNEITLTPLL